MADEITISISLALAKSGVAEKLELASATFDIGGSKFSKYVQSATQTAAALVLSPLIATIGTTAGPGYAVLMNLDAVEWVDILTAATAATPVLRVPPGAGSLIRFGSALTTPYIQASLETTTTTGTANLQVLILEC